MAILGVSIKDVKPIEGKYILQILFLSAKKCVCVCVNIQSWVDYLQIVIRY